MPPLPDTLSSGPRHLRVILASPGDVQAERELVQGVLNDVNHGLGRALDVQLDLYQWETDAYPGFHVEGGQGLIDRVLKIEESDLLIGLFWTRFGGKIKTGETGTEHEIRAAINARGAGTRPQIMLYFSEQPVKPGSYDHKQYEKVAKFQREMRDKGVYWPYDGPAAFAELLRHHLANWLNTEHARPKPDADGAPEPSLVAMPRMIGVPSRNPLFTGRVEELALIEKALAHGVAALTSGVAALQGMGGEGKTQTAVEYAYRHAGEYARIVMVRAERPGEFEAQMAALAGELELPEAALNDPEAQFAAVRRWFATQGSWLLLVDNAEGVTELAPKLPRHAKGRVLLTTRETVSPRVASPVPILHLDEGPGALLLLRCAGLTRPEADGPAKPGETVVDGYVVDEAAYAGAQAVSRELLGLALALDHAGTYLLRRPMTMAAYLDLYRKERAKLFVRGENPDHDTVTVTFTLAVEQIERIETHGPAAAQLVRLCAFLAPDVIPDEVFRADPDEIEAPLTAFVGDDWEWQEVVAAATRFALIRREADPPGFSLHRLVAEVVRDGMDDVELRRWTEQTVIAVNTAFPNPDYANWPLCARILPHALTLSVALAEQGVVSFWMANLLYKMATYLQQRGRYSEALALFQSNLAIRRTLHGTDDSNVSTSLNNLGLLLILMDDVQAAAAALEEAVAIDKRSSNTDDLALATHLDNLAKILYRQNKRDEASEAWRQSLALTEGQLGPSHPIVAVRLNNLSNLLGDQGEFDEAEVLALRGLEISYATRGELHPESITSLLNLGALYVQWGQLDTAERFLLKARELLDTLYDGKHESCAHARGWLAALWSRQGRLTETRDILRESLSIFENAFGYTHSTTVKTRAWLAQVEREISDGEVR